MKQAENMPGRNVHIDGLRGIGLLLVMCSHFFSRFTAIYYDGKTDFLGISQWGAAGVAAFLLITGYFIVPEKPVSCARFIVKRVRKLWPLYFIAILLCFGITHIYELPGRTVSLKDLALNIPFINGFIGTAYVDHAHWYLTTLIGATAVFSVIQRFDPKKRHILYWVWLLADLALCLVPVSGGIPGKIRSGLALVLCDEYAPVLILGAIAADVLKKRIDRRWIVTALLAAAVKALTASPVRLLATAAAIALFALALLRKDPVLKSRPLVFLGRISYPTYLVHQNIGYVLMLFLCRRAGGYRLPVSFAALAAMLLLGGALHAAWTWAEGRIRLPRGEKAQKS